MRRQFEMLRQAVAAGEVDAVVVYSASRLPRDGSESLALLKEFDSHDLEVHVVKSQHGILRRAMSRLSQTANTLVKYVLSLVGRGD